MATTTLSDADRLNWIRAISRVGGAQAQLTNAQTQLTAATTAQDSMWAQLKTKYPGLKDGDKIDAKTGVVDPA